MLDTVNLVCPVLRNPLLATVMPVFGYFGHVTIGTLIGLGLLGLGSFYKNSRIRLIGIVILIAVLAALGIAEAFKYIVQPSTQQLPLTYGLPSSQAAAAFALASTLSVAFPGFAPIFFALAILAGIARLYSRGQYFWNVLGGSALGLAIGLTLALKLVPRAEALDRYAVGFFGWLGTGALTLVALIFFYWSESNMAAHLIPNPAAQPAPAIKIDFGAPQARSALRYGWSADESWPRGQ